MHKFLKTIGFSNLARKDLKQLMKEIIEHPQMIKVTKDSEGNEFAELSMEYARNIGITIRGIYDDEDQFHPDYYYPYFHGTELTTEEQVEIDKHAEKESYAGVCDEVRVGVTMIFYLNNVADYLAESARQAPGHHYYGAVLSGLSSEGKILLPIEENISKRHRCNYNNKRNKLIAEARDGNEEAIENLTMEDMDMYNLISRRIQQEDVLSIVNTYMMPYGIECDQYSILGHILDYAVVENRYTQEKIYCMKINCNDMIFDICINSKDLMGVPEIGRRFKGNIWMQGSVILS